MIGTGTQHDALSNNKMRTPTRLLCGLWLGLFALQPFASVEEATSPMTYSQSAEIIRHTYESQLFSLNPYHEGHYGLRMLRQTQNQQRYRTAVWSDITRVADRLNQFADEVNTPEQVLLYSQTRLAQYRDDEGERSQRRYNVTKNVPEYLYLGMDLLSALARADEYGLKHRQDTLLRSTLRRYDFSKYVTSKPMIEAWGPQLANQVYWLRHLGEQDIVDDFVNTLRATYPDEQDSALTAQQYANKLDAMTHLIVADSGHFQTSVKESDHQWIFDYFRRHIDTILLRAKEDVIAEVGISFLLAGLNDDPVVETTRKAIQKSIDADNGMIPSSTGNLDLNKGEHRNVLAILLLDWQGVHQIPTLKQSPKVFDQLPYGLQAKS